MSFQPEITEEQSIRVRVRGCMALLGCFIGLSKLQPDLRFLGVPVRYLVVPILQTDLENDGRLKLISNESGRRGGAYQTRSACFHFRVVANRQRREVAS